MGEELSNKDEKNTLGNTEGMQSVMPTAFRATRRAKLPRNLHKLLYKCPSGVRLLSFVIL